MSDHPNLVYVFPDEFRQQAMGFMEQDPVITPNLDRFASESVVFTHAVSNFPVCSPYRAMLFSGKYPFSTGVYGNCYSGTIPYGIELQATERCFSDVLHDAGYSLGYLGKLHLDLPKEENVPYTEGWRGEPGESTFWDAYTPPGPRRHGIDFWHSYGCCDNHLRPHYWEGDAAVDQRIDVEEWSVKHEADVAVDYIRNVGGGYRQAGKPFALFVAHNPPHMPFSQVPPEYLSPYAGMTTEDLLTRPNLVTQGQGVAALRHVRNYFAAITGIDQQFGRILEALDQEGLSDDTIVIFGSDHGEMMGSHGLMHKGVWYDESLLTPFIARWPGHFRPGSDDLLLSVPDIMPSLLSLMGLGGSTPDGVEGNDYSGAFLGGQVDRPRSAFYLQVIPATLELGRRGVRTRDHTFVVERDADGERVILHDQREDPYQMRNVAQDNPAVVRALREELDRWLRERGDPWKTAAA